MRRTALSALLCAGIAALGQASSEQPAGHPVISEIRYRQHSGKNEEFVELYNPTPRAVDLSGWSLAYKKKTGGNWDVKVVFRRGHSLRPGGYFLWGGAEVTASPDSAESGASGVGLGNSGGNIALRDPSGRDVDRVAWEGGDSPEGRPAAGKNVEGGSLERKAHAASTDPSMSPGGTDASRGNGFDTDDNETDFVLHNHFNETNPQNSASPAEPEDGWPVGSGTCDVTPLDVQAFDAVSLRFTFRPDSAAIVTGLVLAVPEDMAAMIQASDIRYEGKESAYADAVLSADTIRISGLVLLAPDSLSVTFPDLVLPAQSGTVTFPAWFVSREGRRFPAVEAPRVEVRPAVIPAIRLHANDTAGVPVQPFGMGTRVMVSGVVTAGIGPFFENRIFIQDATAGLCLEADSDAAELLAGDSITVTGTLGQNRGLTEIRPDWTTLVTHSRGCPLPRAADRTCAEINDAFLDNGTEPDESRLVRVPRVRYDPETGTISDGTGGVRLFMGANAEADIPEGPFDAIGLLVQEKPGIGEPPYTSDYGILPRDLSDMIPLGDTSAVSRTDTPSVLPQSRRVRFESNRPNPFNCGTLIRFSLPAAGRIRLSVLDARGREAAVLLSGFYGKGTHAVLWDGADGSGRPMPSGVYIWRIEAFGEAHCRKIMMIR
ncbi:MAG: lamin tail domain-containing protein [bacterium]|nr:lamin tail domain-containing protein [bacterium]